jgi:methylenetetrahydrofolate reductase (NADPH)
MPRGGLARVAPLLRSPRYEVFPAASTEQAVLDWVPRELTVTVTASPARGLEPTLALATALAGHGYPAVPHVTARLARDDAHLADIVARLTAAGISDIFVPGGDATHAAGRFHSALELLEQLAEMGRPFARVGITGYPESHPKIDDDITIQSMWDKRRHAAYLVSNLCFDPATLRRWITRVRARGVTLPLLVGLPGPVDRARLLGMAAVAGVSESARFWPGTPSGSSGSVCPATTPAAAGPGQRYAHRPGRSRRGLHIFTYNQLRQTEEWRRQMLALPRPAPPCLRCRVDGAVFCGAVVTAASVAAARARQLIGACLFRHASRVIPVSPCLSVGWSWHGRLAARQGEGVRRHPTGHVGALLRRGMAKRSRTRGKPGPARQRRPLRRC